MAIALAINGLTKIYANDLHALESVNLEIKEGDFFALLGPNGAGKTTLIGIVSSLLRKTQGKINVFGHDLDKEVMAVKRAIGLVPQEFNFGVFETVLQIVLNQAGYYGIPRKLAYKQAEYYLKKLDLWQKRHSQVVALSGGMKRRLLIARALLHEPKLLILDEPTAGVDLEIRYAIWDFLEELNKQGITIILTTHYLEEAEKLCRTIAIIDKGRIVVCDKTTELLSGLAQQTFLLTLKEPLAVLPECADFSCKLQDPQTLLITLDKEHTLNDLFADLSAKNIAVLHIKARLNRLEQIFLDLVNKNNIQA